MQRIKGIGPKLEQTLHEMGVTDFAQIAAWTDNEVREVNAKLRFQGRIERDEWLAQARAFIAE
ncbi:MAG: putative flap endonuclease-1-like 5' DNA nuclease [Gammaproteobacteria bacterium]